jgi:hypothetical protein
LKLEWQRDDYAKMRRRIFKNRLSLRGEIKGRGIERKSIRGIVIARCKEGMDKIQVSR